MPTTQSAALEIARFANAYGQTMAKVLHDLAEEIAVVTGQIGFAEVWQAEQRMVVK